MSITLNNHLKGNPFYQKIGASVYLDKIVEQIPTSANIGYYLEIVKEKALRRQLIHACNDIVTEGYQSSPDAPELVDNAENKIFNLAKQNVKEDILPINPVLTETLAIIKDRVENKDRYFGVQSGFSELDEMTGGFQKSDLIILAARPSMGKTALALNITENASLKHNKSVVFFSLEMSRLQLCQRLISSHASIDSNALRDR